jgi:hypothetical protein
MREAVKDIALLVGERGLRLAVERDKFTKPMRGSAISI